MSLSVEQKLAINTKIARDMWPKFSVRAAGKEVVELWDSDEHGVTGRGYFNIFDPEKGDLNKAVEFYGLSIVKHNDKWVCGKELIGKLYYYGRDLSDLAINKDRNLSMQQAVTAASGVNNDI